MLITDLVKEGRDFNSFLRELRTDSLSNAYLISSEDKLLLETFSRLAIQALFCTNEIAPCGKCLMCRKAENNTLLDILTFGDGEGIIKKEEIEKLITEIMTKPFESERKVFVIKNAERMNASSQNMLLKTLEELPSYAHVFLLVTNELNILSTIKSRVRKISLSSFTEEEIMSICYSDNAGKIAKVCGGFATRAIAFCENKNFGEWYNFSKSIVQSYTKSAFFTEKVAFFLKNKQHFEDLLAMMQNMFHLALKKEMEADCSEMALIKCIEAINRCNQKLRTNANMTAVVDELFMTILEEKNRWKM